MKNKFYFHLRFVFYFSLGCKKIFFFTFIKYQLYTYFHFKFQKFTSLFFF